MPHAPLPNDVESLKARHRAACVAAESRSRDREAEDRARAAKAAALRALERAAGSANRAGRADVGGDHRRSMESLPVVGSREAAHATPRAPPSRVGSVVDSRRPQNFGIARCPWVIALAARPQTNGQPLFAHSGFGFVMLFGSLGTSGLNDNLERAATIATLEQIYAHPPGEESTCQFRLRQRNLT
jgi:hypothetical protein